MKISKQIAGILGPFLVAVVISEIMNLHIWRVNIPSLTYLNGSILFLIGLIIVRFHNVWTRSWPVVLTISGWILILGGLARMFFPEAEQLSGVHVSTYVVIGIIFLIGAFLTLKAYGNKE